MSARAREVLAAGGEVWVGDETALREFPSLRAAWARRGTQALVEISGRNTRRVLHGALNVTTGETVGVMRPRSRGEDAAAGLAPLAALRPGVPKLLVWDNAPPHRTRVVRAAAEAAGIELAFLPFRSPGLTSSRAHPLRGPLAPPQGRGGRQPRLPLRRRPRRPRHRVARRPRSRRRPPPQRPPLVQVRLATYLVALLSPGR